MSGRAGETAYFVARAPGRVNLIGEHTDYNDGFVLPMAIDREVRITARPRADGRVVVRSVDFDEAVAFDTRALEHGPPGWSEYVKGCAWALQEAGFVLKGWEGELSGDVPSGAGLSSSAAVELATLRVFAAASELPWNPTEAALLGQRVENEWIGVNSGIMDQLVIACAVEHHALLIDCRTLDVEPVPLPASVAVVVLDTSTRRGLVESAYNERRRQCEAAACILGVVALRDVDRQMLADGSARLEPAIMQRARHVVTENERTLQAAEALRAGDLRRLGELMNESHASLRADFEVTNDALDEIVASAHDHAACFGARMTGAGFGGCAVAIVDAAQTASFIAEVSQRYRINTGLVPHAYACRAAGGASIQSSIESVTS